VRGGGVTCAQEEWSLAGGQRPWLGGGAVWRRQTAVEMGPRK